jgi:hypothetical protein
MRIDRVSWEDAEARLRPQYGRETGATRENTEV